jgi:hypothetical protein
LLIAEGFLSYPVDRAREIKPLPLLPCCLVPTGVLRQFGSLLLPNIIRFSVNCQHRPELHRPELRFLERL